VRSSSFGRTPVTPEGFPLSYEVFGGNRADVSTLEEVLEAIERKYGRARRVWVFDRGVVSEENLQRLRQRGARYAVAINVERLISRADDDGIGPLGLRSGRQSYSFAASGRSIAGVRSFGAGSTRDLLETMETIQQAGGKFRSLSEPWADTTTHAGKMIITIFAGIAE
jgi:resolvase-like protein/DDE family transposase